MTMRFRTASELFENWKGRVLSGVRPTLYQCGPDGLGKIEIGPGLITLIGGKPGAGKTALTNQLTFDGVRKHSDLRTLICNVEVAPETLLDRQLARLSGVDAGRVRLREFEDGDRANLTWAFEQLEQIGDRIAFVEVGFDLRSIAKAADEHKANLVVLDYVQRIQPPGDQSDRRGSVDALMKYLREFAQGGMAVVAVSSVGRTRDAKGRSSYAGDGLGLASFKESSELEFGADNAFMLVPSKFDGQLTLKHLKARYSEPQDIELQFDARHQQFNCQPQDLAATWERS